MGSSKRIQEQHAAVGGDNSGWVGFQWAAFADDANVWFLSEEADQRFAQEPMFRYKVHILNGDGVDFLHNESPNTAKLDTGTVMLHILQKVVLRNRDIIGESDVHCQSYRYSSI